MGKRHAEVLEDSVEEFGSVEKKKRPSPKIKDSIKKTGNTLDTPKKPNWVKLKEKKKELKVERKKKKTLFEVGVKSKQIWEQMRKRSCSKSTKNDLVNELHKLLKGSYVKAVFSHDVGRVVQWLLKLGTPEVRQEIATELKGNFVEMCQSKYGSFCIKQLLKRGSGSTKSSILSSFFGNVVKLMSHRIASPIISSVYSTQANSLQKCHLRQEFYGDIYRVMKNDEVKNLKLALELSSEMRNSILGSTKANLLKVINKDLVDSQLVNAVLAEFILLCNESDRSEIITSIHGFLPQLTKTKEGAKVGMMCVRHGTQKDRKAIIKSLKGSVAEVAVCEHGYLILLSIFDSVDDTVLVKKAILSEIITNMLEISKDKCGRKVVLYLVAPRDPSYFHPDVVEMLKLGDGNSHSKKPSELRRKELLDGVSEPLLESIASNISEWFGGSSIGMVTLAMLKAGTGPKLRMAFESLAKHVCSDIPLEDVEKGSCTSIVENPGSHFILKKLVQYDKERNLESGVFFSDILVTALDTDSLLRLISSNRGCFLLVALLESGIETCVKQLKSKMNGNICLGLEKYNFKGSEVLRNKLVKP